MAPECFTDRELLRRAVCEFKLEWPPGSRSIYHRTAAHWVVGVLIEAITGADYRDEIRKRVIEPLGLTREMFLGLPEAEDGSGSRDVRSEAGRQISARSDGCRCASGARDPGSGRLRNRARDGRLEPDDGRKAASGTEHASSRRG